MKLRYIFGDGPPPVWLEDRVIYVFMPGNPELNCCLYLQGYFWLLRKGDIIIRDGEQITLRTPKEKACPFRITLDKEGKVSI